MTTRNPIFKSYASRRTAQAKVARDLGWAHGNGFDLEVDKRDDGRFQIYAVTPYQPTKH